LQRQIVASQSSLVQAALTRKVVPQGQLVDSTPESATNALSPAESHGETETPATDLVGQTAEPGTKQDHASARGGDA